MGLQWRQQLDVFSNALQTGQLDVQAFGLEFLVGTVFYAAALPRHMFGSQLRVESSAGSEAENGSLHSVQADSLCASRCILFQGIASLPIV